MILFHMSMRGAQWRRICLLPKLTTCSPRQEGGDKICSHTRWARSRIGAPRLSPDQAGLGYRKIREPFDNHSFLMALAATFGGHINLAANQIVHMPVVTFEALAFTALTVSCHLWSNWVTPLNVKLLSLF